MTSILSENFETQLGTVRTWIETDSYSLFLPCNNKIITKEHEIIIQAFELDSIELPEGMNYENSKGWMWFIKKINKQTEQLTIFCKLVNPKSDTTYGANSGEYLDAIEIEDKTYQLHIGTEDGEVLQYRAKKSDWMPKRFENELDFDKSFTEYIDFGFKTTIPKLEEGEKIYFHFLVATNPIRQSKKYPDELDVSTWYAVDQSKKFLDNKLENIDE